MSFRFRDPPPPAEICKRQGITLAPIITKCFDETISSEDPLQVTQIHLRATPGICQDKGFMEQMGDYQEVSRWSSTTEDSISQYSEPETESESKDQESYEEKLERYRHFFDNRPLMGCWDTDEDKLLADQLFERLQREVQQQPCLPFEESTQNSRGELQVRAFWDNVRMQLQIDESSLENKWPEGYPPPAGLEAYLSDRD